MPSIRDGAGSAQRGGLPGFVKSHGNAVIEHGPEFSISPAVLVFIDVPSSTSPAQSMSVTAWSAITHISWSPMPQPTGTAHVILVYASATPHSVVNADFDAASRWYWIRARASLDRVDRQRHRRLDTSRCTVGELCMFSRNLVAAPSL
jgi:hypothetical protein